MIQSQNTSMPKETKNLLMNRKLFHQENVCNACILKHKESKDDYDAGVFSTHSSNLLLPKCLLTLLRTFVMMLLEVMMLFCLSLKACLKAVYKSVIYKERYFLCGGVVW